jgi:ankyrin repeat protein
MGTYQSTFNFAPRRKKNDVLYVAHDTPHSHTNNSAYVTQANTRTREQNAKMNDGSMPLHYACEFGREAVVSLLLENGAKVNVEDIFGNTPLHVASKEGNEDIVALLLEKDADPTITNDDGKTPLQIAQENNKENCIAVLTEFARRQQEKKQLERQEVKEQEETKKRLQPQEAVASAKRKKTDP